MGTWGVVCAFDEARFRTAVVPAARSGPDHPIIAGAIRRWRAHSLVALSSETPGDFAGLAEVMTHIDDSFSACDLGRNFYVVDGEICTRSQPPDPSEYDGSIWDYDDFVDLMEWILTRETLQACAWLGSRGSYVASVFPEYRGKRYLPATELDTLLARLDHGAAYLIEGASGEGVHGWLDAAETRRLASLLPPKPRGDMSELSTTDRRWLQAQLWAVLDWAIDRDLGLLWGRDLSVLYEDHPETTFFDDGATLPVWLEGDTEPDLRHSGDDSPELQPAPDIIGPHRPPNGSGPEETFIETDRLIETPAEQAEVYRRRGLQPPTARSRFDPAALWPYEPREPHQLHAGRHGYFWLPCGLCGGYFGGHEIVDSIQFPGDEPDTSHAICPVCTAHRNGGRP